MLKKLQICFLGYLCPPKSKLIPNWFTDFFCINRTRCLYLTAIGGLFHRRSRSISQAEGLHISCINNHIRGVTIRFVLVLFFGIVIKVNSQVAFSPAGIELVDNPGMPAIAGFHRSGETRSDTFLSVTAQDIDGGPGLLPARLGGSSSIKLDKYSDDIFETAVDYGPSTVDCFDASEFQKQEGAIPSAPSGALIYGEIINPDSLAPLQISFQSDPTSQPEIIPIRTTHGTFFDGVLDPRVRKFQIQLPSSQEYAYFSLMAQGRMILEDFLISPSDSIKIRLDLESSMILFGGPAAAWMEVQYQMVRAKKQARFESPRNLYQYDIKEFLDQKDHRKQWETANALFGARLNIISFGGKGIDSTLPTVELEEYTDIPGYNELESFRNKISTSKYQILKADLVGNYFASKIASFRKYQYVTPARLGDTSSVNRVLALLPELNQKLKEDIHGIEGNILSVGYHHFLLEWLKLRCIETGLSLRQQVLNELEGETQNRLLATLVKEELARGNFDLGYLDEVLPQLSKGEWKTYLQGLKSSLKVGVPLQSVTFETLEGGALSLEEFKGQPTLFYFYFSTCAHSANYFDRFLWPIYQETAKQAGYRLVAVSIDDDPQLWKSSIQEYSDPSLVNLNLPKSENKNWLDHYMITAFPRTILLDSKGRLLSLNLTGEDYEDYKTNLLEYLNPSTISSIKTKIP